MERSIRLAWFRVPPARVAHAFDDGAAVRGALAARCDVTEFPEARAHEFVWRHFRAPFDLCVFEHDGTPASAFVDAYLAHVPGVLWLRGAPRIDPLRLTRTRVVAVPHAAAAARLQTICPAAAIRHVPVGVEPGRVADAPPPASDARRPLRVGLIEPFGGDTMARALARAREAGARADLVTGSDPMAVLRECDVAVARHWPPAGAPESAALMAMAHGLPVVVLETESTADWPALDPQTWQPRGLLRAAPVVISVDPRDEEHSLMLAIRRLAADSALRATLGAAARAWWRGHATLAHATRAWEHLIEESLALPDPHVAARDGSEFLRGVLDEFGVTVDFLPPRP